MKKTNFSRRKFISTISTGSLAAVVSTNLPTFGKITNGPNQLAILGGEAVRRNKSWPEWPYVDEKMVDAVVNTTRSGIWSRIQSQTGTVLTFEKEFAQLLGTNYAIGTGSGTQALSTCVEALGIGAGDEVITSPYTDMGTISSILMSRALPVMADLDPESYQMDPDDIERKITKNTKAIMPVHIMGYSCDMERIMDIASRHDLKVIEDACQAALAEYQGKKLGTIGDLGCFSFQASKVISCGEGGAIVGNDQELMDKCYAVQNRGADRQGRNAVIGTKYRMNEFEGAILMGQMPGVKERFDRREENANYLTSRLKDFRGVVPQKVYEGNESGAHYKYAMSYRKEHFNDAERSKFLQAVRAEGVALSGYIANGLHREPWTDYILNLDVYQKMYSPSRLREYRNELSCPNCDKITDEEMLVLNGPGPLLGTREDMDDIVDAILKVYENRDKLETI
ncbi:MAG: DegT/DnrJ/EryC1/StrS family aminotransferase [Balneolales bacterium]